MLEQEAESTDPHMSTCHLHCASFKWIALPLIGLKREHIASAGVEGGEGYNDEMGFRFEQYECAVSLHPMIFKKTYQILHKLLPASLESHVLLT